jgi:hypothetical protein
MMRDLDRGSMLLAQLTNHVWGCPGARASSRSVTGDRDQHHEITPKTALPSGAGIKPATTARRWVCSLGQLAVVLMLSTGSQATPKQIGAGEGLPDVLRACSAKQTAEDDALMRRAIEEFLIYKQNRRAAKRTFVEIVLSYPDRGTRRRLYEIYLRCSSGILAPSGHPEQAAEGRIAEQLQHLANTDSFVADVAGRHNIEAWDEARASMLDKATSNPHPTRQDKARYFRFLRDASVAYDGYATDLFLCWKSGRCHRGVMNSHCSTFNILLDQMRRIDEAASQDPFSA